MSKEQRRWDEYQDNLSEQFSVAKRHGQGSAELAKAREATAKAHARWEKESWKS